MAHRAAVEPVQAFVAVLAPAAADPAAVERELGERLGALERCGEPVPFDHTGYYEAEMGPGLVRRFVALRELMDPARLVELKQECAALEDELAVTGRRVVNLDPGYIDCNKVVLASYKFGGQKVHLRDGVYADIVLLYARGRFEPFAWTFPDFAGGRHHRTLLQLRARLKARRRALGPP